MKEEKRIWIIKRGRQCPFVVLPAFLFLQEAGRPKARLWSKRLGNNGSVYFHKNIYIIMRNFYVIIINFSENRCYNLNHACGIPGKI